MTNTTITNNDIAWMPLTSGDATWTPLTGDTLTSEIHHQALELCLKVLELTYTNRQYKRFTVKRIATAVLNSDPTLLTENEIVWLTNVNAHENDKTYNKICKKMYTLEKKRGKTNEIT